MSCWWLLLLESLREKEVDVLLYRLKGGEELQRLDRKAQHWRVVEGGVTRLEALYRLARGRRPLELGADEYSRYFAFATHCGEGDVLGEYRGPGGTLNCDPTNPDCYTAPEAADDCSPAKRRDTP